MAASDHPLKARFARPQRLLAGAEEFYATPSPLQAGHPGEVIRVEEIEPHLWGSVLMRARAWRILYRSTTATGKPSAVSGTVMLPAGRDLPEALPLLGYAIGTHGIGDNAAPSKQLPRGREWEAGMMSSALTRGWALAITDYQGLGTPGDHTFMVGRALGPNVLDAMRAARSVAPAALPADGPAAILGYSEGGAAAAWAAQLQPTYAPELALVGVAAGAAAANLETAGTRLGGSRFSFFIAYCAIGYAAAYPELDLDAHLTPLGREWVATLRESTIFQAMASGRRVTDMGELTDPTVLELPDWRLRLDENRLGEIAPQSPVLLHHARWDRIVSFSQSEQLRDDWRRLGVSVRLRPTRGGLDHISGALAGTPFALDWLGQRLAEQRTSSVGRAA
jgi:pimeloyl-ACP methyl ester carboxylesterase